MDINDNAQTMVNKRDLAIQVQLEKISRNAIKDIPYRGPLKMKTNTTKDMIEKYQRDLQNTFYTDENGVKKRYYMPASVDVTLETPDPAQLQPVLDDAQLQQAADNRARAARDIAQIEAILVRINDADIPLNLIPMADGMSRADRVLTIARNDRIQQDYDRRIAQRDADLARFTGYLENAKQGYERSQNYINTNESKKRENEAYINSIEMANRSQLKVQSDEVNRLNRGRLILEQQPNEDADQFKTRMLETGQATFDEDFIEQQAELRVYKDLKMKMKDIVRDELFIDQFLKTITAGQDYDDAFKYDKAWTAISRAFREFYGEFNDNITVDELRDFFDNVIQRGSTFQSQPREEPSFKSSLVNPYTLTSAQLRSTYANDYKVWYSKNRKPGVKSWSRVSNQGKDKILEDLEAADIIQPPTLRRARSASAADISEVSTTRFSTGAGMLPKEAMIGRVKINPRALYYDNMLVLLHENGHHFQGFRNTKVSDAFVNVIMKLMNDEEISSKDVADLELAEKPLFDHFLYLSGHHKKIGNGLKQTREQMKERFQLLEGQRDAGNTNPEIMEELINLLYKMSTHKMISRSDAFKHIKSYK
jgi:hypothetical protein